MSMPLNSQDYIRGKIEGDKDAKDKALSWFFAGLLFGFLVVIASVIYNQKPKIEKMNAGFSEDYILGFSEGFYNKSKSYAFSYSLAGVILWFIFLGILGWLKLTGFFNK